MKVNVLFLTIFFLHARCQRRGPWRGMRPPPRRLPCVEERLRLAPNLPSYGAQEIPAVPLKKEASSTLEAAAQIAQNIPKPDIPVPTTDFYQNVLLSPNLVNAAPNHIMPNLLSQNEVSRNHQVPLQNIKYLQTLLTPKPQEVVREVPILEVPRIEKVIVQPYPEKSCPCSTPQSVNPFLPAVSPLSPWMASNLTPPTQARSHFLRKIPIPPPTL